jgi:ABC-type Mn2+/Zn2+ transport system permease subunit
VNRSLVFVAAGLALILAIASAAISAAFKLASIGCVVLLLATGLWLLLRRGRRRP